MSSTAVLGFIKDIAAKNVAAVQDRLKSTPTQGPNQRFTDPKEQGLTYTLLHKAVEVCSPEIVSALLAAGASVNAADSRGRTSLHWLASSSHEGALSLAEHLLKQPGIDIHAPSNSKATPLHEAAAAGNIPMLQLLLKHGANPQDTSPGFTALHAACMGSCTKPPAVARFPAASSEQSTPRAQSAQSDSPAPSAQPDQQQSQQHDSQQETAQQGGDSPVEPTTAEQPAAGNKPGQLKQATAGKAPSQQQGRQELAKPPAAAGQKKAPSSTAAAASTQRPRAAGSIAVGPARAAVVASTVAAASTRPAPAKGSAHAPNSSSRVAAQPGKSAVQQSAPVAPGPPTKSIAAATKSSPRLAGTAGSSAASASAQHISSGLLEVLLASAPELLRAQDSDGFTPLMRLVQRGAGAELQLLLGQGDCNINAQAVNTGDTALHLACSCPRPDLGLITALVAAGANPLQPRFSDGNTPLLLAAKSGGGVGLELARALLQALGSKPAQRQQQRQQQGLKQGQEEPSSKPVWASLDAADSSNTCGQGSSQPAPAPAPTAPAAAAATAAGTSGGAGAGVDAANTARETAASVAAAAVLATLQGPAAAAAGNGASGPAAAQQELLALLLGHNARLPAQMAGALLQQGLAGKLPDGLTAKVLASMADMPSLQAAAAGGADCLDFDALLGRQMYRTAVALLSKRSGKPPCDIVDEAGNTLLHTAVSGAADQPDYVSSLLEAGVPVNAANKEHDAALHLAARQGHVEACRALVLGGADLLRRNGKNRIPGSQLKLCDTVKAYLQQAEEEFRAAKEEQRHALWDDKMRATQTQSAFGIRVT